MSRRKFIKRATATALGAAAIVESGEAKARPAQRAGRKSPKKKISTDRAPRPVGPYSQAVVAGNTIYVAGQVPADPATRKTIEGDFEKQATQVFENIKAILGAAGATFEDVVKVNVYLADLGNFAKMNEVYRRYFSEDGIFPVRTTVGAQLLPGFSIEVDCIAVK